MDTTSLPQPTGSAAAFPSGRSVLSPGQASWSRASSPSMRPRDFPAFATVGYLPAPEHAGRGNASSATWTSSSGDPGNQSDTDDVQDRFHFVEEYNRLAKKHGIRLLVPEDYDALPVNPSTPHRRNWFSRTFSRHTSATSNGSTKSVTRVAQRKRSVTDIAMHIVHPVKKDSLKDEDLQSLVRLCGKSLLYLPSEYAPCSLILPTCFRATAQYLVQHAADAKGVFRIPGSARIVVALYDYYCAEHEADEISRTIRCPNLPLHIKAGVHDVASAFKKFLAGLPGGILGSLSLFDALVAIHSQLEGDPETNRTKQSKLRARLISLAIGGLKSQYRRELICAVFGLLSLIGRNAEKAPREDDHGRPLPTGDLMGYSSLGIVFGPLLVSDLLESYTMKIADPNAGLVLLPLTPPKTKKERRRSKTLGEEHRNILKVDKVHVANRITEMLITHWREVVKHMKNLGVLKTSANSERMTWLRPSASESFANKRPFEWNKPPRPVSVTFDRRESPSPVPPSPTPKSRDQGGGNWPGSLDVRRKRPRGSARSMSGNRMTGKTSIPALSPTLEESPMSTSDPYRRRGYTNHMVKSSTLPAFETIDYIAAMEEPRQQPQTLEQESRIAPSSIVSETTQKTPENRIITTKEHERLPCEDTDNTTSTSTPSSRIPRPSKELIKVASTAVGSMSRPKSLSKKTKREKKEEKLEQKSRATSEILATPEQPEPKTVRPRKSTIKRVSRDSLVLSSRPSGSNVFRTNPNISGVKSYESLREADFDRQDSEDAARTPGFQQIPSAKDTPAMEMLNTSASGGLPDVEDQTLVPTQSIQASDHPSTSLRQEEPESHFARPHAGRKSSVRPQESAAPRTLLEEKTDDRSSHGPLTPSTESSTDVSPYRETQLPPRVGIAKVSSHSTAKFNKIEDWGGTNEPSSGQETVRKISMEATTATKRPKGQRLSERGSQSHVEVREVEDDSLRHGTSSRNSRGERLSTGWKKSAIRTSIPAKELSHQRYRQGERDSFVAQGPPETPAKVMSTPDNPATGLSRVSFTRPTAARAAGQGVRAMAAMFESANRDSVIMPPLMQNVKSWGDSKPGQLVSQYTVSISPSGTPTKPTRSTRPSLIPSLLSPKTLEQSNTPLDDIVLRIDDTTPSGKNKVQYHDDFSANKPSPRRRTSASSGSESAVGVVSLSRSPGRDNLPNRSEKFAGVSLKQKEKGKGLESSPSRATNTENEENRYPLNLGRMTPHQEEPNVARHINFSRPPSSAPSHKDNPNFETLSEVHGIASPGPQGGNSLLHSQIRTLQKQLEARTDEVKQLRRQLETKANLDLGTLSEQLRQAKRECRMWRERAEAAEKRVAVFERFTAKIRKLKEKSSEDESGVMPLPVTARMMKVPEEEDPCLEIMEERANRSCRRESSPHTEDEAVVRERIRKSFQRMDGCESNIGGSDTYGADESEGADERGRSPTRRSELPPAAVGVWMAAQELLEHENMRNWLNGPL